MYPLTNYKGGCRYRHKYENIDGQWVSLYSFIPSVDG
eukprot:COSAG02_NODE_27119_length_616_cov_1.454545_2_plen_36_part_01